MRFDGNSKRFEALVGACAAILIQTSVHAQWTTIGNDIWNSNTGRVGINGAPTVGRLDVWGSGGYGVYVRDTNSSGSARTIYGQTASSDGWAITGHATSTSGSTLGVYGQSASPAGIGVLGYAYATSGTNKGVFGWSQSEQGYAMYAHNTATTTSLSGAPTGLLARVDSTEGTALHALSTATSGVTRGVYVDVRSPSGYGLYVDADNNYIGGSLGVGTNAPSARLHTDGTVRMQNLGAAPTNTTLLTVDGSGNVGTRSMPLMNGIEYFSTPGIYDWYVPAGVTKIRFKGWGGGGNGHNSVTGPGGSGAYVDVFIDVTPGEGFGVTVGNHGTNWGSNGGYTEICRATGGPCIVLAYAGGGKGATNSPCCAGGTATLNGASGLALTGNSDAGSSGTNFVDPPFPGPFQSNGVGTPRRSAGTGGKSGEYGFKGAAIIEY